MARVRVCNIYKKNDISKNRYMQMYFFCLQYDDWKKAVKENQDKEYVKIAERNIKVINKAAKEAADNNDIFTQYLIKAVTHNDRSYNDTFNDSDVCDNAEFYLMRRNFYLYLNKELNNIGYAI
ncbi:MAG: hypothetical protein IJ141_03570 [Lachnospiraceae bacterium]|nr:hypothetical protein [Lachnospiraceae bacterium]